MSKDFSLESSKIKRELSNDNYENISRLSNQETNYEWNGLEDPSISNSEDIFLIFDRKFTLYENNKLSESTIVWTSKRAILFGTEVRKSLVASMVSRELEQKRGLERKHGGSLPPAIKGWDIPHSVIKKVEIVKNGEIYSTFFFDEEKRLYIINDLDQDEVDAIKTFLEQMKNVILTQDEFRIPASDILLLCLGGIGITIIGWIIIVLFF